MKNLTDTGTIDHSGVVFTADANSVTVCISSSSACSGCLAEGSCNMSAKEEKIIEIKGNYNVKPGDTVTVLMKQSMGYSALLLGYVLPLILVIAGLIILVSMKIPELMAGIFSVSILIPYYSILYFFRKRINENFSFTLKV